MAEEVVTLVRKKLDSPDFTYQVSCYRAIYSRASEQYVYILLSLSYRTLGRCGQCVCRETERQCDYVSIIIRLINFCSLIKI